MEKNNLLILIGIIVVIAIAVILFFVFGNKPVTAPIVNNSPTPTESEPESIQDTTDQPSAGAGTVAISYANALVKYADRRIQLDTMCQAHPNTVTYKDNTGIMIDNRSPQTRTIKVGTTFTIRPYGFKIVVLPDIYLASRTLLVDCDQSQNVATILIQE